MRPVGTLRSQRRGEIWPKRPIVIAGSIVGGSEAIQKATRKKDRERMPRGFEEAALRVVENWAKAFTASDVDDVAQLYARDATMIGTNGTAVLTTPEQIRGYFEVALTTNRPRGARIESSEVLVVDEGTVIIAGLDTVT